MESGRHKQAQALDDQVTVFYVDNHLRPYTGKHVIRRGWRMQDKRVLPGTTDYYVHDEVGRPVMRIPAWSNDSLTTWLSPLAVLFREALGEKQRLLLAFDRAGAYPMQLVELRDFDFEFVTYERRPYPLLSPGVFTEQVKYGDEVIGFHERNTNLGRGRGRVRRIALRMEDGYQVNLLAVSNEPTEHRCCMTRNNHEPDPVVDHHHAAIASLFGMPSSVMRLITLTPIMASLFWASNCLARRRSPMIRLYRYIPFSARAC